MSKVFDPTPGLAVLAVMRNRQFRHLWLAQICSQLAANMMLFLLALVVYQNTASNTAVSGLFLAYGIPAVLFGFLAGTVVDRLDRRQVLLVCDLLRAILVIGLFFLTHQLPLVYLLVFLNALITQFYVPSEAPLIPKLVAGNQLLIANSLFSFTYYTGMASGFILAGPLLRLLGTKPALAVLSLLFLAAAANITRLPAQEDNARSFRHLLRAHLPEIIAKVMRDLKEGLRYVRSLPALWDGLLLLTGTQVTLVLLGALGPGFADRMLAIDIRDSSVVIIGPAVIGIILGALWVANFGYRLGPRRLIRTGILSAGIILMLVSLTVKLKGIPTFTWLFADWLIFPLEITLFFLLGIANSLLDVPANSILQKEASGDMRGRVYGLLTAAVGGVGILPIVIGGILADVIGVGKVIFILGLIVFSYGIWRVRYNRSISNI